MNGAKVFGVANLPGLSNNLHYIGSDSQTSTRETAESIIFCRRVTACSFAIRPWPQ